MTGASDNRLDFLAVGEALVDPTDTAGIARGLLQVVGTPRAWEVYRVGGSAACINPACTGQFWWWGQDWFH